MRNFTNDELDKIALENEANGDVMLREVHAFLGRFISYPSEHAQVAHALWIVHAHLMELWDTSPRLAFLSPEPASGKSRALDITELLVPVPVKTISATPAYLFRKLASEEGPPTVLFDEIDTIFGPRAKEHEDLRAFLNAGHARGATAGRCVIRGKTVETEDLPAFAAVALAGLGQLPHTIMTRSIVVRMRRRAANEHVEAFRRRRASREGDRVRDMITAWASVQPREIDWDALEQRMPPEIQDRIADVWEPLFAVADLAGGKWPGLVSGASVALVSAGQDAEQSLGVRLLADIRVAFQNDILIPTNTLLDRLLRLDEAPWSDLKGRQLDARGLAKRLKEYGIKPKTFRSGLTTPRGYDRADFEDNWGRYCPPTPEKTKTAATAQQSQQTRDKSVSRAQNSSATASATNGSVLDGVSHSFGNGVARSAHKTGVVDDVLDVGEFRGKKGGDWLSAREVPDEDFIGPAGDRLEDFK